MVERHAVTPYGRTGGSSRVRVFTWIDRLPEEQRPQVHSFVSANRSSPRLLLGHPVRTTRTGLELRSLARARPEWLMLHREASPLSRGRLESTLVGAANFSVYDLDDALYSDVGAGPRYRRLAPKAPKAVAAARAADRVVAGNTVLADWASSHAKDVVVVPSCVEVDRYVPKTDYAIGDPPRLVWIGSSDNESLLTTIAKPLLDVHSRTGARLTVVGTRDGSLGELNSMVDRVAWSEAAQHEVIARADLGLMPLRDDPYSRGKCGYKLLQYAACGVPAVGSPVGANADVLADLGLPAADDVAEWGDRIFELLLAPSTTRRVLGTGARSAVEDHYSYEAWHDRWLEAVGLS